MRYLKLFEKFNKEDYFSSKKEKESKLIQELGDEYIVDIVKEGDFEGLNFLLDTGYDLIDCGAVENLLNVALSNNQMKMFDYLLDSDYVKETGYDNPIDIVSLHDFVMDSDNRNLTVISDDTIRCLKILADRDIVLNRLIII